jgi:PAS domain S-box-containing protein
LTATPVSDLVVALQNGAALRDALAEALRDQEVSVLYWTHAVDHRGGRWVDLRGHSAPDPVAAGSRAVRIVEHDGSPIAAITYDAAVEARPELLDAVTAAAGLALRNERLQAQLRAEVEYWDAVTNSVPSLLTDIGTDGRIQHLNAAALEASGFDDKDDVLGRLYWDVFIDHSERDAVIARFEALAPDFPPGEYENRFVNARGDERVVFWRTAPIRDASGTVTAIVSGGVDITARRKGELKLQRERDVQSTVFESMPSIMVVLARDGTIRDRDADNPSVGANAAFREAVQWPDEKIVGRPFLDLVLEDDDRRAAQAIATAAAGQASESVESELLSADGNSRTFTWWAVPVGDVTGRTDGLVLVTGIEITEQKKLELEKERERTFLNAIANNAPSLLCVVDAHGHLTVRGANIAFERTLEYDPAEIGGQVLWDDFVVPAERDDVRRIVEDVVGGGEPKEHDNTWTTSSGRELSIAWTCTPLPAIDDRTLFLITGVDITERKRAAEELHASRARLVRAEEQARRGLERNLHDGAQQRLVALSVALRLVESRIASDPDAATELLVGAREELSHALAELRELARGIHPAVLTDRGLRPALEALAARAPIPVLVEAPDERLPPDVEAAAYYVVAETLTNVARYAHASEAQVSVVRSNGGIVVTVSDDGVGGADPSNGSGLSGLVDRIAVLDGALHVDSPLGGGTTVRAEIGLALVEGDRP